MQLINKRYITISHDNLCLHQQNFFWKEPSCYRRLKWNVILTISHTIIETYLIYSATQLFLNGFFRVLFIVVFCPQRGLNIKLSELLTLQTSCTLYIQLFILKIIYNALVSVH